MPMRRVATSKKLREKYPTEYRVWAGMRNRCHGKTPHPQYGGKGIKVCKRWRESFAAFVKDMGPRPSPKHSIDRIDGRKNYTPKNCRWATSKEQGQNVTSNVAITFCDVTMVVQDWAILAMCNPSAICTLMKKKLPISHHLENAIDNIQRIKRGEPPHRSAGRQYHHRPNPKRPPQKPYISHEQRLQKYVTETTNGRLQVNFPPTPIYHTRCSRANWHHPRQGRRYSEIAGNQQDR